MAMHRQHISIFIVLHKSHSDTQRKTRLEGSFNYRLCFRKCSENIKYVSLQ
jgi:hypothetical protein